MKRIAVLTSGGDAPGMNAAIRAVVRTGIDKGWEVLGISRGFAGLIEGRAKKLGLRDVSNILQHGGTLLGSSRSPEFKTEEGLEKAIGFLNQQGIEGLVVIGGNGSQAGAYALSLKGFPVVGVASTIDNDLYGSEISMGVDTALNIALEAIDRLKVTASSHQRAILVEVMGRDCGYLALMTGMAGGAEAIILPEAETPPEEVARELREAYQRGKSHALIVVAEGAYYNARRLEQYFQKHPEHGFELRVTILGYVQRGGAPTAFDRLLGTRFGSAATDCLARGEYGVLIGIQRGAITCTPLSEVVSNKKPLDLSLWKMAQVLAR